MTLMAVVNQLVQELQRSGAILNLFLISLLLISVFVVFSFSKSGESKLNLSPSLTRLPVIRNLHQLGNLPHRSLQALSRKYGPLMLLRLGQVPTLVVSSAEIFKQIMQNHDEAFSGRPETTATHTLMYNCEDIAFAPYGECWKQLKTISVVELLSLKRVKHFQYARDEEVSYLINKLSQASLGESPVKLSEMLITFSSNIMSRCTLGETFAEDGDWYGKASRKCMMELMSFSIGEFFPSLRWIDTLSGYVARLKAIATELDGFFDQLIEGHKKQGVPVKDFVDILLQHKNNANLDFELTEKNLKAILQDMFVAGTVTISTTVEWLMTELARNPSTMEKVQREIRRVVGKKASVEVDDITQMDYLKCVIKETLRLHSVALLLVPRQTNEAVELGGYHIPAKTTVFLNAFAIQRDPKIWERPDEFVPDRFEGKSVDLIGGEDFKFVPFGGGRRRCPGQAFAVATLESVVANLLYWFDWKVPSGDATPKALDIDEAYGITVCKKTPLYLHPVPYSP